MTSITRFVCIALIFLLWMLKSTQGIGYHYACDPECVEKCQDELDEMPDDYLPTPVCVHIQDVELEIVTFPTECLFHCANKCYEYQLHVHNRGECNKPEATLENDAHAAASPERKPYIPKEETSDDDFDDEDDEDDDEDDKKK